MAISLPLIRIILSLARKFIPLFTAQRLTAISHRITYRPVPSPLNVLVLGGSYTGVQLARRLVETLPTGYRVVLIEKKTHFNHLFNFPRYAVVKGREEKAFIPYDGIGREWLVPEGIFERVTGTVTRIGENDVEMMGGERIPFAFLAVCTGATLHKPGTLLSSGKAESCEELRDMQTQVERAGRIVVVGGGAVGVQIAGDIRSFYPEKEVVLVHSRRWLLSGFGEILGRHVRERYEAMGIRVLVGERPVLSGGDEVQELVFSDGKRESFDLVIPCTGQKPNSSLIAAIYPDSISPTTGEILVKPTLQLASSLSPSSNSATSFAPSTSKRDTDPLLSTSPHPQSLLPPPSSPSACPPNIFALGDVAATHGPKMARASFMQAEVVIANILSLIHASSSSTTSTATQQPKMQHYHPTPIEGTVSLSLGLDESVSYMQVDENTEFLWPGKGKGVDLEVRKMWWMMGVGGEFRREFGEGVEREVMGKRGGGGKLVVRGRRGGWRLGREG